MKQCAHCGQDVKDRVTVCPTCKKPITAPAADVFPELRSKKRRESEEEAAARLAREKAEREAQEALAPDDPAAELHAADKRLYDRARDKRNLAASAYTGILFFVPLYACKDKKYGYFHANQGLVVLMFLIAGFLLNAMIGDSQFGRTLCFGYFGGLFYLMVLGIIRGFRGKMIPLPIIGSITLIRYREKKQ